MSELVPQEGLDIAARVREVLATYREAEDLITIGAYKPGQNPRVDEAVQLIDSVQGFLKQRSTDKVTFEDSWRQMAALFAKPAAAAASTAANPKKKG
jgi:flagellum-specific ATP synthase